MNDLDLICLEIGSRGRLSRQEAKKAAFNWKKLQRLHPSARFMIAVAGYDEDPRALWEIPEAAAYIRTWARLAGLTDPETAERAFRPEAGLWRKLLEMEAIRVDGGQ